MKYILDFLFIVLYSNGFLEYKLVRKGFIDETLKKNRVRSFNQAMESLILLIRSTAKNNQIYHFKI